MDESGRHYVEIIRHKRVSTVRSTGKKDGLELRTMGILETRGTDYGRPWQEPSGSLNYCTALPGWWLHRCVHTLMHTHTTHTYIHTSLSPFSEKRDEF